jgi:hypothetical protein
MGALSFYSKMLPSVVVKNEELASTIRLVEVFTHNSKLFLRIGEEN